MTLPQIIPAIIPQSLDQVTEHIERVQSFVSAVQIDIVDGQFVSTMSWPYTTGHPTKMIQSLSQQIPDTVVFELDLMIRNPLNTLALWCDTGPARIVLHVESFAREEDIAMALDMVREQQLEVVLALGNETPLDTLTPYIARIDGVQCMGIAEIGAQGNAFDERVLSRISTLKKEYPHILISVDGSVNHSTIVRLRDAGAERFVVGSAIFGAPDPHVAYTQLQSLLA